MSPIYGAKSKLSSVIVKREENDIVKRLTNVMCEPVDVGSHTWNEHDLQPKQCNCNTLFLMVFSFVGT